MNLKELKLELSVKAKNGIDFIVSASIIWILISYIWTLEYSDYNKSILTFMVGGLMFPFALLFSKVFKTTWKIKNNPIQSLGLWLNIAQLLYFPFLIFIFLTYPKHFVMTYAIITGAHFFPYAWFYNEIVYAIFAGLISFGAMFLALTINQQDVYIIPLYLAVLLIVLASLLFKNYKQKLPEYT